MKNLDNQDKVEELLNNYRSIRSNIEIELNKRYPEYSLDSVSFVQTNGETNVVVSQVEQYVIDKYSVSENLRKKIQILNIINAAYKSLSSRRKEIITDLYFEDKELKDVAAGTNWSRWSIGRKRDKILNELERVGILEAWELWEQIDDNYKKTSDVAKN